MSDNPTIRFEERLLVELRGVVAARPPATAPPAPRRARRPRLMAAAGLGVAGAAAAAIVLATSGGGVSPAYAVQRQSDGTVTVHITSLRDAAGLERALRDQGLPAEVHYSTGGPVPTCAHDGNAPPPPAGADEGPSTQVAPAGGDDGGPSLHTSGQAPPEGAPTGGKVTSSISRDADGVTFSIAPGTVKDGEKVYITTSTGSVDTVGMAVGRGAPGC